jgi:arylsulfatase A-like enzyme
MVTELDYGIGNVTAALKASGQWDNTLIVVTSDNGGPLGM